MIRSRSRRQVLGAALAAGAHAVFGLCSCSGAPRPRRVRWWVTDRSAQRVTGLDDRLAASVEVSARHPSLVRACEDGGAWILTGQARQTSLMRIGPGGELLSDRGIGPLQQLFTSSSFPGAALCLVQTPGGSRLVAVPSGSEAGVSEPLHELCSPGRVGASAVQGRRALFSGAANRELVVFDLGASPAPIARSGARSGEPRDVAAASRQDSTAGRGWWSLEGGRTRTLTRWSEHLRCRWARTVDFQGEALLADPVRKGVWVVGGRSLGLRFFSEEGEADAVLALGVPGPVRALAATCAGPLLALPGAVLALDDRGRVRAFQGGFRGVADLSGVHDSHGLDGSAETVAAGG